MYRFVIAVLLGFTVNACIYSNIRFEELKIRGNIYFYHNTPFTGKADTYFDSGELSGKVSFVKGIPSGEWTSLGYDGELIQYGTFKTLDSLQHFDFFEADRINICEIHEGEYKLTRVFVVSKNCKVFSKSDSTELNRKILDILQSQGEKITKIDDIVCKDHEI